ncbi:hypothetical protein ACIQFU_22840 [Streptomyces sp. NPDC093065]|uniref:hypothetical protein n=1 Tax=Streptomyces sp. NPDC093065 TaxID=3366021 RepID=UPI00380244DC
MSAPLVINTKDGACWTRRTVTSGGIALYALADVCQCPEFVMATLDELAARGIAGSADVLPMPAGPAAKTGPRSFALAGEVVAEDYDDAVYAAEQAYSGMRGQGYKGSISVDTGVGEVGELRAKFEAQLARANTLDRLLRTAQDRVAELEAAQQPAAGSSYPPALPWARLMDHEDLTDFLDELAASAITHATAETALAEVEKTCGTWRLIAEAQHAHNTAPGPDAEAGESS